MSGARSLTMGVLAVVLLVVMSCWAGSGHAASPTGAAPVVVPAQVSVDTPGFWSRTLRWIERQQQQLNRDLAAGVKRLKEEGSLAAVLVLSAIGFLYGVFHAAGPGHGKAIISAYVLANERTAKRGIALAFLAGLFQALSAIALVGILAVLLGASGLRIQSYTGTLEQVSYALIALIGAWMLIVQLRGAWARRTASAQGAPAQPVSPVHGHDPHAHPHHHHHHHHHDRHHHHDGHHEHAHHDHAHLPGPSELEGEWSWRRAVSLALAVGIRPCTGAILVLVFALAQGLFWAGVAATFAMALGTAITVSVLAALAVWSRNLAVRFSGEGSRWAARIETIAGIGGAGLVFLLGTLFFAASLGPQRPF